MSTTTPANTSVAAHIRAEREKARQEVMASCAAWRQGKTPPSLRESPPRASKTAALACIASQSHRPPPEERPGYVPVASVVVDSVDRRGSVSTASPAVGRSSAATANRLHDSPSSSSSGSSPSAVELLTGGTSDYPSDLDEPTDAEVGKYTFHERLIHYMEGEKISPCNRKAVELVLLIEAGTYVRGLNPMRKPQMGDMILKKYQRLIGDIADEHFVCESVRNDMLAGYKGAKKSLTGKTLWRKMEREMTELKTFASKFPGINCPSELPSGSTQLRHMKKPYIIKLWSERFPVM